MVTHFIQPDADASRLAKVPRDLPILPLRHTLAYPFSVLPLAIGIARSVKLIEDASWAPSAAKWRCALPLRRQPR
jgi:ATP-dependent Lon protease